MCVRVCLVGGKKEGNVLFNDALNTFYLRLYGVRHMVKDHSDSEKGNPLPPHRLLFTINSKGLLYAPSHSRITHTTAYVTPVVEHCLEREVAQWVHHMKDRSDNPSHREPTLPGWRECHSVVCTMFLHRLGAKWGLIVARVPKRLRCLRCRGDLADLRNMSLK